MIPGHIDSPQSFTIVSWIGVRLFGRLAVPLAAEFVGAMVALVAVIFHGLMVTFPVVMLNGTMVESVLVMFHGLIVRFPIVLLNGGMIELVAVMLTGVLLLGVKAKAAARLLKRDSDRTAPLVSLLNGL